MGNNNSNLQTAKNIKDDEFYTTYEAIEKELQHYLKHFRGKVVLCNCDDPFKSNFCRYFVRNFNKLGLKRLICTSYVASEGSLTQTSLFDCNQIFTAETHGRVLDLKKIPSKAIVFTDDDIENFLRKTKSVRMLCGDGDFRSSECVEYLKQADIVVTNPPFSLFKELVALLVKYQKSYLLIGNQNALTYKEIFPLIQNNQEALEKYSEELLEFIDPAKTHKFYWEKPIRRSVKPHHPGENDPYLPEEIRGQHFDSWTDLAKVLGYGE